MVRSPRLVRLVNSPEGTQSSPRRGREILGGLVPALVAMLAVVPVPSGAQARSQRLGDSLTAPVARCGTLDREARELLYGFPFDPSDCSATETNPNPEYDPGALYEIPVVVHIIMDDSCTQGVISDAMVDSQIEILNEDFLALPGTNGEDGTDAQIQFVLASEDPDGNPTTGITRDCNSTWFNDNGAYWDELAWDPHNYLNIYTNLASGALGYVPFLPADGGGSQVGQPHDRVVILWEAFGRDAPIGPPYDQGRTATHEVGHYLGLEHTFTPQGQCGSADPPGCHSDGDLICDTEVEQSPRFGCPVGTQSCGSLDPIDNYMDYSDDLCMEEFTLEQMRRNRCTLQFYRPDLYNEVTQLPELAFDPAALEFGDVEVGTTSLPQTAMLTNTGDADATGVVFNGLPDAGFVADTSACGATLPAGESCAVSVTFTPATEGPATATLHVASDEDVSADLTLSGNGIGGGGGPIAEITPDSFTFEVEQGGGDNGTLSIGNIGDADLTWSLEEAEAAAELVPQGAPYRYGLAETPAFDAPVGADRATRAAEAAGAPLRGALPPGPRASARPAGRTFAAQPSHGRHGGRPLQAAARVLPAPQPAALGSLTEGFDDITQLPGAGWALINNSDPPGPSSWFQGNETIFPAHEGDPDAYIAANFESTTDNGTISNWLITPEVTIVNGTTITFWTRKAELFGEFADRMEVRMSVEGASTDVGDTAESVGDFVTLLLTINPELVPGEYPQEWTSFTVTVRERSREPVTGRFAFRYWVTDSGPDGTNGDYIGIDTVSVTQPGDVPPGGCDNPLDIPWLSADPTSGTTPPAGTVPVNVTVDTTDLETGEYTAQLCLTTNDPAAPLIDVPVSLTVTEDAPPEVATFEALGDLPGGAFESYGRDISEDGAVVVGMSTTADGSRAFRWQDGVMTDLGSLPGGSEFSDARDVSADGSAVSGYSSSENGFEAFRWQDGVMTGLGDLPDGNFTSLAFDISPDGAVIVGWGSSAAGREAFRWEDGVMTGLGDLDGGVAKSEARAISSDGSTIVGTGASANGTEAFRLAGGVMTPLGDLPSGGFNSVAHGVSADGSVVVGQSAVEFGEEAYRWEDGVMIGLGDLSGGAMKSFAYDVTADGAVIVGYGNTSNGFEAAIWTAADGLRNLREVLETDYGLDLTGWQLWEATAISDDGTAIAGYGTNPDGNAEAWRVLLPAPLGANAADAPPARRH